MTDRQTNPGELHVTVPHGKALEALTALQAAIPGAKLLWASEGWTEEVSAA